MMLGIMQGRLFPPEDGRFQSFPRENWRDEFERAAEAGLKCIEWIDDTYGEDINPIHSDEGIAEMKELMDSTGVVVRSLCADAYMERPFIRVDEAERQSRVEACKALLKQCQKLGIRNIVLPFVDNSSMKTDEEQATVIQSLEELVPTAEECGVEVHLETDLDPQAFKSFLDRIPSDFVKVNYDSGNSSSLGYDHREEFAAYGDRIGSVHIKDRVKGGATVPLGEGDADLDAVFEGLQGLNYDRLIILQVARSEPGDEVSWAIHNRQIVEGYLQKYGFTA